MVFHNKKQGKQAFVRRENGGERGKPDADKFKEMEFNYGSKTHSGLG